MAGFNVTGLPAFIQYQGQLQAQEQAKQQQQMQLQMFQQQQQDRQRQQAAQAAAGNALPQLVQPPPPMQQPAPQPPAPGQASQPMQQAGGGVPLPQGPVPGQVLRPPLPPGGAQGAMPPQGVPPFRPMPTTPPQAQAAPQGAIPAPPAQAGASPVNPQQDQMEGGFSLSNIIQSGQKQGLSGTDLYDYVQTMEPYMTSQQKAKAEQFKTQLELKKLDAEIALHSQAAQNQQLSREERERHDQALERLATQRIGIAQGNLNIRIQNAGGGAGGAASDTAIGEGKPLPNPTWEANAQAIARGQAAPIPLSSRAKGAQETMARVFQLNPDYDAKDYGTHAAGEKYWATGVGSRQVNAINTAFSHLGNLQQAGKELQNGGLPAWNAFANRVALEAGAPAPTNFEAQKEVVADEVVKAMVGAGGGTLEDRKAVKDIFSNAKTPDQMQGAMESVRRLMAGKLEATERQYKQGTGRSDFRNYLSPEAASYLPQGGGEKPAAGNAPETKTIGNKTYVKRGSDWYEQ